MNIFKVVGTILLFGIWLFTGLLISEFLFNL
jgi:hypothetical protein